ncbi:hypothetical protein IAT38_000246 [Cryptococcus sp. DSM 104549]
MSTPNTASPSYQHQYQPQDSELFSLDFLALAGLDSSMPEMASPQAGPSREHMQQLQHSQAQLQQHQQDQQEQQQQHQQHQQHHHQQSQSQHSRQQGLEVHGVDVERQPSGSGSGSESLHNFGAGNVGGHPEEQGGPSGGRDQAMEVDQPRILEALGVMGGRRDSGGQPSSDFDSAQAAMLQQQLQAIHMQSPLGFDINNPSFPLAQLLLASPAGQQQSLQMPNGHGGHSQHLHTPGSDRVGGGSGGGGQHWQGSSSAGGTPTPGPSEMMSPLQLEMLAWAQMEGKGDPNMPLLSPALSQHTSHSAYNSPMNHVAFNTNGHRNSLPHIHSRSPLEQLQEQQRVFQEQLALLQRQQVEMQATAAAVMAASTSTSPYGAPGSSSLSGGSRPSTTPGIAPSPGGVFSPLTSPALEATNWPRSAHQPHQHFSPANAFNTQHPRPPHPLSAMSSPALNPTGSSGGAQQTLSPALGPQNAAELADPEYIRALVGMLDNGTGDPAQPSYQSPSMASTSTAGHTTILSSPALIPINQGTGTGPHRQSLPAKSRPSPMLKPTGHRSHHRNSSQGPAGAGAGATGTYSVPTSPAVQKYHPSAQMPPLNGPGGGYLPASVIEHRQYHSSVSTTSTPSPVDLSQIMPPPPVPNGNSRAKKGGVVPMTPASLMNLGETSAGAGTRDVQSQDVVPEAHQGFEGAVPPPPPPKGKAAAGGAGAGGAGGSKGGKKQAVEKGAGKKGAGSKLVPAGAAGKRTIAARPGNGVGIRAATKAAAAAAAAAAALAGEPETRKTSHKAAEQKRRDSLKLGFDELRLLLPPINTEALDPISGEPIPGSSAPRLLPKSSLVPDDNPNRGVSKVALLRFGNEYIEKLQERVERRDGLIERLMQEVRRLREDGEEDEVRGEGGEDLLDIDWRAGEDDEFGPPDKLDDEGLEEEDLVEEDEDEEQAGEGEDDDMDVEGETPAPTKAASGLSRSKRTKSFSSSKGPAQKPARPSLTRGSGSETTVTKSKKGE